MPLARMPRIFPLRYAPVLAMAVAAALAMAGCASTSDLKKLEEDNQVQDRRLRALEQDTLSSLTGQESRLKQFEEQLRALQGRLNLIRRENEKISEEQTALREGQERALAGQRKMTRLVNETLEKMARFKLEADNDLDKMRVHLTQLESLQRSNIANLPDKTRADKAFRQANFLLINGELDLAADRFEKFRKSHPKDERGIEALYRQGQAYFLLRKYDHALIPFFEVVKQHPQHKLATSSRWMLARSLEETGDLKLAREFYAQLITGKTEFANDATRRVAFINKLFPGSGKKPRGNGKK